MENLAIAILLTVATFIVVGFLWLIIEVIREVIDSVTFSSITWAIFFNRVLAVILIIIVITAFWYVILFA